jgi:nucleoporin GLE1
MLRYPPLKAILLGRFAKNCPWTVPYYKNPTVPNSPSSLIQTEEAMKKMGYKRTDDGKWEETTRYIERQAGIFAVWTAMTTHKINPKAPTQEAENHPFPLFNAWRWAARTLQHQARCEIECAIMATFLEVVNQTFVRTYGRQGRKLVALVVSGSWTVGMKGPAVGRLEIMGEEFQRTGRIGGEGFGAFGP